MNSSAERKFVNLRKRLDQLGYRQPLGIESLPLVDKLFSDLVHTTESLRNAKSSAGKTEKESRNVDALLEPYRAENARVVRENNELHLDLLKLREEKDRVTRELKAHIRRLDHETLDLKFLNNQYAHKVRCLEKDGKAKVDRIQQLQEKNLQAVVQTPGGKKRSIPFRRQKMQLADGRIHELQEDIVKLKVDMENAQDCIKHLNTQVEERDGEISRLNNVLHGGRPHNVISLEARNISNHKLIAHLNLQIEYLQETNRSLEEKIEGLLEKKKDVSAEMANLSLKNRQLCEELTHIDDLAKHLEMEKEGDLETADMELQEAKEEIQRQQKTIEDLEEVITKTRREQSDGEFKRGRLQDELVELKGQNEKMEALVNLLEGEKSRLQDKVEKMMSAEKELVLELEKMRAKHGVCGRESSPSRLDAFIRSLEEERDCYRREAEKYQQAKRGSGPALSPSRSPDRGSALRSRGNKHMEDIQKDVKVLSNEKDHFKALFKQAQHDLQLSRSVDVSTDVLKLQEDLEKAEVKLEQLTTERDALMERLKNSALTDKQGEERRTLDLECTVQNLEQERLNLQSELCVLKERGKAADDQPKLLQNAEDLSQLREEANALRLLKEQMEQLISDYQHRFSVKTSELQKAHQQIEEFEERLGEFSQQSSKHREEVASLQKAISALDREKDALQDDVDRKTEKLVVLQEELSKKEKTLEDVRQTVKNMDVSLAQLQGVLKSREREISSQRRQLDACQEELAALKRDKEIIIRENKRLQDDLTTMTRENQAIHAEMEEALHEKDEMKLRVHSYISEVSRIEKLIATKEQENRDLLERFRMAHSEVEEREQKLQQAAGLNNSIRLELLSSDAERRQLRDTVRRQDTEIQQHIQVLQAYETRVSSLAHGMSKLEEELHKEQQEKVSALSDLASVRELCVKLDSGKELTARQLTSKSMELEKLTGELADLRSEKEFQSHLAASERESELKVLRDRLTMADNKTEVSQLRGRLSQLQTEKDVLKRQVTTERFERERLVQEMRRQGLSFSSLDSNSSLTASSGIHGASQHSIFQTLERSSDKSADK
uniref:Centrosomal protein 135 n=1 Tax=Oryzias sinensis TaxID=183150 RepID=A0A8C7X9R2_9TELE